MTGNIVVVSWRNVHIGFRDYTQSVSCKRFELSGMYSRIVWRTVVPSWGYGSPSFVYGRAPYANVITFLSGSPPEQLPSSSKKPKQATL